METKIKDKIISWDEGILINMNDYTNMFVMKKEYAPGCLIETEQRTYLLVIDVDSNDCTLDVGLAKNGKMLFFDADEMEEFEDQYIDQVLIDDNVQGDSNMFIINKDCLCTFIDIIANKCTLGFCLNRTGYTKTLDYVDVYYGYIDKITGDDCIYHKKYSVN